MMKHAFVALALFAASAAHADFNGKWNGTGNRTDATGWTAPCDQMSFDLAETTSALTLNSAHFKCGDFESTWTPGTLDIVGTSLMSHGNQVGTISDSSFEIELIDPSTGMSAIYDWAIVGQNMSYNAVVKNSAGVVILITEGALTKQ